ncbi:hypothetical protein LMF89_23265 [Pelosinus sp. Bkl1]|uniref:Uncharacterized protein n=1 Tax=Pelosinus baikalensis TaxID=2892015 RepID=A0ABS8HYL3_9FIRM|nr:hypothetical protein [Pelosinus baikalensis]
MSDSEGLYTVKGKRKIDRGLAWPAALPGPAKLSGKTRTARKTGKAET